MSFAIPGSGALVEIAKAHYPRDHASVGIATTVNRIATPTREKVSIDAGVAVAENVTLKNRHRAAPKRQLTSPTTRRRTTDRNQ